MSESVTRPLLLWEETFKTFQKLDFKRKKVHLDMYVQKCIFFRESFSVGKL